MYEFRRAHQDLSAIYRSLEPLPGVFFPGGNLLKGAMAKECSKRLAVGMLTGDDNAIHKSLLVVGQFVAAKVGGIVALGKGSCLVENNVVYITELLDDGGVP